VSYHLPPLVQAPDGTTYSKTSVPLPNTPIPHSPLSISHSRSLIPAPRWIAYRPGSARWSGKIEASLGLLVKSLKGTRKGVDFGFGAAGYGIGDALPGLVGMYVLIQTIFPDISHVFVLTYLDLGNTLSFSKLPLEHAESTTESVKEFVPCFNICFQSRLL